VAAEPTDRRACFASVHGFGKFPRATRREAGRAEHPNLLARHLSTGPSRSPRMGAADPPRPGRHGRRIAVLFGQLCRLGRKPMQARLRLGQSSAAASADYATGRREPIYLLAGGAEEPKGLRQHGIPAGRQRHCLPLLSVRCSLRLRRNAAGHTNKAARMPGPPPKGRTASRERPSPGRSLRFGGSDGENKWRRGGTIYEAVDGGGGSGALVRAVARIPGSPSTIERHTASPNAVSPKGKRSGGTTLDFLLPRRINQFLPIRRRVLARQASSAVPKPALEGRESGVVSLSLMCGRSATAMSAAYARTAAESPPT
jgi:hypothetical protein